MAHCGVTQGGAIKLYKELACPLDGFQLVLFSLGGADGKTYPLCPFCYNHPPFEDAPKVGQAGLSLAGNHGALTRMLL